jgi:amino-acid N-acetyltransferase
MEDVAVSAATALKADKLIFITETPMMVDQDNEEIHELSYQQADEELNANYLPPDSAFYLEHAAKACKAAYRVCISCLCDGWLCPAGTVHA